MTTIDETQVRSAIDEIATRGFAIMENAIDAEFATRLRDALEILQEEDHVLHGKDFLYQVGQEGFVINIGDRGPLFEELLLRRPMMPVVEAILGQDVALYLFQGVLVPPGGGRGAYPWKWHSDLYHVNTAVGDPGFLVGLNCLIYLDDVDSANGGTYMLPGTQGLLESEVEVTDLNFIKHHAVQVTAPKGSAALFNPLVWHCAGANTTDRSRWAIKMLTVRDWVLPQMDYARSVRPEVLARLDDGARRLLGCDCMVRRSYGEDT